MARRQVTQVQLAAGLGLSQPAIARRLSGRTPLTLDDVEAIAGVLDVPTAELLPGPDSPDAGAPPAPPVVSEEAGAA